MAVVEQRLIAIENPKRASPQRKSPRTVRYVTSLTREVPTSVRWFYFLFIFTLPFEATDLGFMSGRLSLAKLSGLLFFATYIFYYNGVIGKQSFARVPHALWWFLGYVGVYVMNLPFLDTDIILEAILQLLTLLQVLMFFWISADLLREETIARRVLLTYLLSSAIFGLGIVLRVPGFYQEIAGRATGAGENLNVVGRLMTVALIILIYTTIRNYKDTFRKIFLAALALPILVAMVSTGSRGAVVAFIAGAFVYLMPYYKTTKGAISAAVLAVTCVVAVVYIIADNAELVARWQEAYYDRNFSERENIFGATMEMVSERPIFGWGPIAATYQLGFLGGGWDPMDTHNLFLYLLAEVGLVGTIPFLVGLYYCFRSAWKARHGNMGLLPLALLVTTLFGNLSGNNLLWKPQWLVLALATASGSTLSRKLSRPLARVQ